MHRRFLQLKTKLTSFRVKDGVHTMTELTVALSKVDLYTKKMKLDNGVQTIKFSQEESLPDGSLVFLSKDAFQLEPNYIYCLIFGKTDGWPGKPDDSALLTEGILYVPRKGEQFVMTSNKTKIITGKTDSTEVYSNKISFIIIKNSVESNLVCMIIKIHAPEQSLQ